MGIRLIMLAALSSGLLSGCFQSEALLLDPHTAVQPLNRIEWDDAEGAGRHLMLLLRPDGQYDYYRRAKADPASDEDRTGNIVMLTFLGKIKDHPVFIGSTYDVAAGGYVYGVIYAVIGPNKSITWGGVEADCDKPAMSAIATHHHAVIDAVSTDEGSTPAKTCKFSNRADLIAALREVATAALH